MSRSTVDISPQSIETELPSADGEDIQQLLDGTAGIVVQTRMAEPNRLDPERGEGSITAEVTFALAGTPVVGRSVELDIDHLLLEVPVEVDLLARAKPHRMLRPRRRQAPVAEDMGMAPHLELAVVPRLDQTDYAPHQARPCGRRLTIERDKNRMCEHVTVT